LLTLIQKHKNNTKTQKTRAEILCYLLEHNIFLFNPQEINNGAMKSIDIMSYYQKEADAMMKEIDDTHILEDIKCDDELRSIIKTDFQNKNSERREINTDLEGENKDCPKGEPSKTEIDGPDKKSKKKDDDEIKKKEEEIKLEILINQTYELCKGFLFPLLALLSRSYNIYSFVEILVNEKTKELVISILKNKKIEINKNNYTMFVNIMTNIIDNNGEIVDNIREIYNRNNCSPLKLRQLIAKHFIPTANEKKDNAEVPTPVKLVDEMLDTIPLEFWSSPNKVFEPCCGKGNFVLGIFDRFYTGLEAKYPNNIERCKVIMTQCIYYADLTTLNVFITTELLKCHVQNYYYCAGGELDIDYGFNNYTGDTLKFDITKQWNITGFDAVIGNPPYSTDPSKPDTKPLYDKFIEKYISNKLLLFVVPSRWFIGGKGLDKFRDFMIKRKDIVFIQHEDDATKWFGKNIDIEGGVNYFLKDRSYNGVCLFNNVPYDLNKYDCIIKPKYHKIIDIVILMESIINKYCSSGYFKYRTNDTRLENNGKVKCYVSLQKSKDRCKYIDTYEFNEKNTFWKVITARANGKNPKFGVKLIGKPNEIYTDSYISFRVNNEEEAKSLLSYLDTKFANHMLSIRKISQDICENTCKWIPLVPLDRIWNDDKVCEYLKIEQNMYV
jgi:site-specific DNA-methyltransferase (adenine-specific)